MSGVLTPASNSTLVIIKINVHITLNSAYYVSTIEAHSDEVSVW